jgi:hypothetical protein
VTPSRASHRLQLAALALDLAGLTSETVEHEFTELFRRGYDLLGLDDAAAVRLFDASAPTVARWLLDDVVPPVAAQVLRILHAETVRSIERGEAPGSERPS